MTNTNLIWVTPDAERMILYIARVSNPKNQDSGKTGLLRYLIQHGHWSPFEMASMCVEITTSRAISAQIIRHRSFSFQEFSQRYAEVQSVQLYPARRQDTKNRQNSYDDLPQSDQDWWLQTNHDLWEYQQRVYNEALERGIAKECARMLLPMSSTTKIYMAGNLRSWIHYLKLRTKPDTQLEHREIALEILNIFSEEFPILADAVHNYIKGE